MLQSFKKFLRPLLLLVVICLISFETPTLHRKFIRSKAESSTVLIYGLEGKGSGSHVKLSNGKIVILTNKHVCEMTGPLMVKAEDKELSIPRKIIKISDVTDLCALEAIPGESALTLGSEPKNGDELYTLGHPRGESLNVSKGEMFDKLFITISERSEVPGSCKEGKVNLVPTPFGDITVCIIDCAAIELSTPTYPGNSGSPVVNKFGNLVAVIFAGDPNTENKGYAIPFDYVIEFLSSL